MKRYRLYFDESGDHGYLELTSPAGRYLCLLGLFVETEGYRSAFHPDLEELKQKHFPHSPDEPVILHRKELIDARGPFRRLRDPENRQRFNDDFLEFLTKQNYTVIAVVIDKHTHFERYQGNASHPYHHCLTALLAKYCGFLNFYNAKGDVLGEGRGGKEDDQLKHEYRLLYDTGTYFHRPESFQRALTSREIKLKPKSANVAGLQVADLLAYPVKQDILSERGLIPDPGNVYGREICRILESKYNRQVYGGHGRGHGRVFL